MGIKGLHKALSFCTVKDNLENYRGQRLAIDTSSWLHKSVYSFSEKFVESTDSGQIDPDCVRRAAKYIETRCRELLKSFDIQKIYLVMDGKRCPLKADETQDREQKRQENLEEARRLKAQGQRSQAEEKYKGCIRIRDDFTREVMDVVKENFIRSRDTRVIIIWSPYEADAQLTKLCIDKLADAVVTEDSDVLVYSAAAHVAFPVLFKLDRHRGTCDSISMNFLLSVSPEIIEKTVKSNNTFECILQNFAVRQSKRPGFGVRLFVMGCVLGGCDYSINTLEGVGLVNAFKLVRDNAFRNDSVRFQMILQSLPSKQKKKLNVEKYEERLAKSEAVFYYHYVKHFGGDVKPLLTPRISGEDDEKDAARTQHFPKMQRFENDWAFLGDPSTPKREVGTNAGILLDGVSYSSKIKDESNGIKMSRSTVTWGSRSIVNPYNKNLTKKGDSRRPLEERTANAQNEKDKREKGICRNEKSQSSNSGFDFYKYFKDMPDPRYVKRKFPAVKRAGNMLSVSRSTTMSSQLLSRSNPGYEPAIESTDPDRHPNNSFPGVSCTVAAPMQSKDEDAEHTTKCVKLDQDKILDKQDASIDFPEYSHDIDLDGQMRNRSSVMAPPVEDQSPFDLTASDVDDVPPIRIISKEDIYTVSGGNIATSTHFDLETKTSKYFTRSDGTRRVTLDSQVNSMEMIDSEYCHRIHDKLPHQSFDKPLDHDVVDSLEKQHWQGGDSSGTSEAECRPAQKQSITGFFPPATSSPQKSLKPRKRPKAHHAGPLLDGFKRQQEFCSQMNELAQPEQRIFAYSSAEKPKRLRVLTSFFQPTVQPNKPPFHQLSMNTNQSEEDFLWNG